MKPTNTSVYDFRPVQVLIVFSLLYLALAWLNSEFLVTRDLFYNSLGAKLSADRIDQVISSEARFRWIGYVAVPIVVFLKVVMVAACMYTGVIMGNHPAPFKDIMKVALLAETVLVLAAFFRLACLLYKGVNTFDDIRSFYPLSLLQVVNMQSIPAYAIYPIQTINLFEFAYWGVLALGLRHFLRLSFAKCIGMVLTTYGIGLCLWMLVVVFIQLQFS